MVGSLRGTPQAPDLPVSVPVLGQPCRVRVWIGIQARRWITLERRNNASNANARPGRFKGGRRFVPPRGVRSESPARFSKLPRTPRRKRRLHRELCPAGDKRKSKRTTKPKLGLQGLQGPVTLPPIWRAAAKFKDAMGGMR